MEDRPSDAVETLRARDLVNAVTNGLPGLVYQFVVAADGRRFYSYVSEGCRALLGFDAADVIADRDHILAIVAPEERAPLLRSIDESRRGLTPWVVTFRCRVGESWRWIRGSALPSRRENGDTVWNGMMVDVTAQHEAEATAHAAEAGLQGALAEAQSANRAKTEFIGNVSHELRTPLNAIIGFAELLQAEPFGPLGHAQYLEYASHIERSGRSLLAVINTVLELSRAAAGDAILDEHEIGLAELVRPCLDEMKRRIHGRVLTFEVRLPAGPPSLTVDPRQIRRVLDHLLSNAAKFTPDGGTVTLDAARDAEGGLVIRVADTGIGIAADHRDQVFKPFAQVAAGLDRPHQGIGLGLSLSRAIAQAHGGRIELASTLGEGTVVSLVLPRERLAAG
jgi:signal transduction histidine kinase